MGAKKETCGVKIAIYEEKPIKEIRVGLEELYWDDDIHFGMNGDQFNKNLTNSALWGLGARALDIQRRGGRTAEVTYRLYNKKSVPVFCAKCRREKYPNRVTLKDVDNLFKYSKTHPDGPYEYGTVYDRSGKVRILKGPLYTNPCMRCNKKTDSIVAHGNVYNEQIKTMYDTRAAKKSTEHFGISAFDLGIHAEVSSKFMVGKKLKTSTRSLIGEGNAHAGVHWSKAALNLANQQGDTIHFHLDGLGDVHDILAKRGPYSHNVTARELRYVWRNWEGLFQHSVRFYNGFNSSLNVIEVSKPWPDEHNHGALLQIPGRRENIEILKKAMKQNPVPEITKHIGDVLQTEKNL